MHKIKNPLKKQRKDLEIIAIPLLLVSFSILSYTKNRVEVQLVHHPFF